MFHCPQEGKVAGDATIGVAISDALSAVPHLDVAALECLAHSSVQDLLMTLYLSNLTQTHLKLADRIHALSQPL